jgi:hypothetical protein
MFLLVVSHHAMKTYVGVEVSSTVLDVGTKWKWVVSFTPLPLYTRGKSVGTLWIGDCVGPRVGLDAVEKGKTLALPGVETGPSSRQLITIPTELSQVMDDIFVVCVLVAIVFRQ